MARRTACCCSRTERCTRVLVLLLLMAVLLLVVLVQVLVLVLRACMGRAVLKCLGTRH